MKTLKLLAIIAVTTVLSACAGKQDNPPSSPPIAVTGTGGSVAVTPTPAPKPSFWEVMGTNVATFNAQVSKVWNSKEVQTAVTNLKPVADQAIADYVSGGGKISSAQGAALGVQAATNLAPSITSNTELQTVIVATAVQFAGDPKFKTPAMDIAKAVTQSLPTTPTPVQSAQAMSAAGTALSNSANAAPTVIVTTPPVAAPPITTGS